MAVGEQQPQHRGETAKAQEQVTVSSSMHRVHNKDKFQGLEGAKLSYHFQYSCS